LRTEYQQLYKVVAVFKEDVATEMPEDYQSLGLLVPLKGYRRIVFCELSTMMMTMTLRWAWIGLVRRRRGTVSRLCLNFIIRPTR
jgi:hypothetical protein